MTVRRRRRYRCCVAGVKVRVRVRVRITVRVSVRIGVSWLELGLRFGLGLVG